MAPLRVKAQQRLSAMDWTDAQSIFMGGRPSDRSTLRLEYSSSSGSPLEKLQCDLKGLEWEQLEPFFEISPDGWLNGMYSLDDLLDAHAEKTSNPHIAHMLALWESSFNQRSLLSLTFAPMLATS